MKYLVFTEREPIRKSFQKSGYEPIEFHNPDALRDICRGIRGAIIYLDREADSHDNLLKHLSYLNNRSDLRFAIVDGVKPTEDPAFFFHYGAVDYISPALIKQGLSRERLEQVQRFNPIDSRMINDNWDDSVPYSGVNWDKVEEGKEYLFSMLYVGLDDMVRIQEILGQEGAEKFNTDFRNWLDEHMDAWYGYQWLWNGWGGVYLFPFNGQRIYAMEAAMECFLNKRFSRFSSFEIKTTFRLALHLGSSVFLKRGETGSIVSDSINSLFHMAYRDENQDGLTISQEVRPYIPETLFPFLGKGKEFEGRLIYQLKEPL
jgi:hypothetical protein